MDPVNHPEHYVKASITINLEPIQLCECYDFCLGNAIKYILRAPYKGEADQDWEKASYYADLVKELCERASEEGNPLEEDFESEEEELLRMVDYLDDSLTHYIKSTRPKKA